MENLDVTKAMTDELYGMMQKKTGLYLLDPPTGSSKSHSMYQAIARYLVDTDMQGRPILFLTPQKKNLDAEKQKRMYLSFFQTDLECAAKRFDDAFQWLDNKQFYMELLAETNPKNILSEIPQEIKDLEEFKALQDILAQQQKMRNLKDLPEFIRSDQEKRYSNELSFAELAFQKSLKNSLEKRCGIRLSGGHNGDDENVGATVLQESLRILKNKEPWLEKLYPGTFLLNKKLIFMSFDKFCYGNVSLIPAMRDFRTLFDGQDPILVIDELDSTHPVCEDYILNQALSHTDDLIQIFDALHRRLADSRNLPKNITELKSVQSGPYSMQYLSRRADAIYQKYHLNLELKFDGASGASLFSSMYYYTIGRSYSYMEYDQKHNHMLIHIVNHQEYREYQKRYAGKEAECLYPTWLIKALWQFVIWFRKSLLRWALEYMLRRDKEKKEKFLREREAAPHNRRVNHPNATLLDDACRTILDALRIGVPSQQDILMPHVEQLQLRNRKKSSGENQIQALKELMPVHPYFSSGYALTNLCNTPRHQERTEIRFFSKPYAAEGFLSLLAGNFLVIGLSATARVPSLSNYFLPYLHETLEDSFYPMSSKLHQTLSSFYDHLETSYRRNQIQIHIQQLLDPARKYAIPDYRDRGALETLLGRFYANEATQERLATKLQEAIRACREKNPKKDTAYILHRYIEMIDGMWQFYHAPTSHAWLFLNNLLPAGDDKESKGFKPKTPEFDENLLRSFKKGFDAEFPARKVSFFVLRSKEKDGTSFEVARDNIRKDLKRGKDVIVFSAYNSIGVGIDLDYASSHHADDYVDVYPDDPHYREDSRHGRRDFDGFVFGDITHLMENITDFSEEKDPQEKERRRHRLISSILALEEMGQVYRTEGNPVIQDALAINPPIPLIARQLQKFRTCSYVAGQGQYRLIQALGRGNRAFGKNRNIHILISAKNIELLLNAEPEPGDAIHTPEWKALLRFIRQYETEAAREERRREQVKRIVVNHCYSEDAALRRLLSFCFKSSMIWDDRKRMPYELLGRLAMCFPTYEDIETVIQSMHLSEDEARIIHRFADGYLDFGEQVCTYNYLSLRKTNIFYPYYGIDKMTAMHQLKLNTNYQGDISEGIVSDAEARLNLLFDKVDGLKEYFEQMGYATQFKPARHILCPTLFTNFYKGRLGEIVGTYILKHYGGIDVKPITNNAYYETFDAMIGDGYSMIDFKNWKMVTGLYFANRSYLYNKVQDKLKHIQKIDPTKGKRAYIIRLCHSSDDDALLDHSALPTLTDAIQHDIVTILDLVTEDGVNMKAIELIQKLEQHH